MDYGKNGHFENDFKILFSNFVPGCSSRNHAHFWLGSVPMAAWGSGVVRGYPELPGPRPDVLILFPGSIGPSHAEVLVVEEIPHHFPNDPGIYVTDSLKYWAGPLVCLSLPSVKCWIVKLRHL